MRLNLSVRCTQRAKTYSVAPYAASVPGIAYAHASHPTLRNQTHATAVLCRRGNTSGFISSSALWAPVLSALWYETRL
eukprot:694944-Rhodomonas_salina.4